MNPASRISAVVETFLQLAQGDPQIRGWNLWLQSVGVQPGDVHVMSALQAVRKELRSLEGKLRQLNVPEQLYRRPIDGITDAFQLAHLHQIWGNVQVKVTAAEVRANLAWMSWVLSKFDENDIDEGVIAALRKAIEEQETLLKSTELPDGLRSLLESQVEELRVALMLYRVSGVQPIVDAVNKQSGEMRNAPADLVDEMKAAGPEAEGAVAKAMDLIAKAAKVADNGSKIVKFGKEFYELCSNGCTLFGQFLLQGPPSGT